MSVPLTPCQAIALGVLAGWYRGRTQTLAVEHHAHTGRVIVRIAGLDYELTEDGDSVLLHDEPGTVIRWRRTTTASGTSIRDDADALRRVLDVLDDLAGTSG